MQRSGGQFVILHADERDGGPTRQWTLVNGLQYTPLRAPDDVWIDPGSGVRLRGRDDRAARSCSADTLTTVHQLAPSLERGQPGQVHALDRGHHGRAGSSRGNQTAASLPSPATYEETMNTGATSVKAYYLEQTYGDIAFQAVVLRPVQIAEGPHRPRAGNAHSNHVDDGSQEALDDPTLDTSRSYKHIVTTSSRRSHLRLRLVGTGRSSAEPRTSGSTARSSSRVLAHELGHNLGLWHAGGLSCTSSGVPAPMGDSCVIDRAHYPLAQYADSFDAMGNAPVLRQMNMEHKLALGVLATDGRRGSRRIGHLPALHPWRR